MDNTYDDGKSSTFGKQLMSYVMSKLPYSGLDMDQMADQMNPKYRYFENTGERRAEVLSKYSVTQNYEYNNQGVSNISSDKRYSQVMYANIQKDKAARVKDYRIMAAFSEVAKALDEICDEFINVDTNTNSCTELKIKDTQVSEFEYETLQKEFKKYVSFFDFEHKGWSYFRQLLIEGEVFWEHIIHEEYKEEGILGVVQIPTELVDPVFSNVQNVMVKGYLYRKPVYDPKNPMKQIKVDYVPLDKNQVTYVHSNVWNESKTMRLPFLENARRAYRQLSMLEDSIIIYRLARAPERLVFNVDVGNMPHPKAEAYLRKLVSQYWSSKTYDPDQGGIVQKFNPQSILDNFWFAKRTGSEGTNVVSLPGGQNLGQLDDLMYFVKKLYQSLNVPTTRLDPQDAFRDGADMLREELKFAKFIVRMQQDFAAGIKNGFITHLQLKGLMKDFELKEHNIDISFNVPTNFYEVRQQQKIELKTSTFGNIANIPSVSQTYAQKKYLGWSDLDIKANREYLRKDKAFNWELQQIENLGPDWKEQIKAQAEAMGAANGAEAGGGMPPAGGGGGGGGGMPPPFAGGEATVGGEGGAPPETGAEVGGTPPEAGAATPPPAA
jgi:Bacteriophage T4-like portal protein (Gp20)